MPRRLTAKERRELPAKAFGIPSKRKYPVMILGRDGKPKYSRSHAIDAKARAKEGLERGWITKRQYTAIMKKADAAEKATRPKRKRRRNPNGADTSDFRKWFAKHPDRKELEKLKPSYVTSLDSDLGEWASTWMISFPGISYEELVEGWKADAESTLGDPERLKKDLTSDAAQRYVEWTQKMSERYQGGPGMALTLFDLRRMQENPRKRKRGRRRKKNPLSQKERTQLVEHMAGNREEIRAMSDEELIAFLPHIRKKSMLKGIEAAFGEYDASHITYNEAYRLAREEVLRRSIDDPEIAEALTPEEVRRARAGIQFATEMFEEEESERKRWNPKRKRTTAKQRMTRRKTARQVLKNPEAWEERFRIRVEAKSDAQLKKSRNDLNAYIQLHPDLEKVVGEPGASMSRRMLEIYDEEIEKRELTNNPRKRKNPSDAIHKSMRRDFEVIRDDSLAAYQEEGNEADLLRAYWASELYDHEDRHLKRLDPDQSISEMTRELEARVLSKMRNPARRGALKKNPTILNEALRERLPNMSNAELVAFHEEWKTTLEEEKSPALTFGTMGTKVVESYIKDSASEMRRRGLKTNPGKRKMARSGTRKNPGALGLSKGEKVGNWTVESAEDDSTFIDLIKADRSQTAPHSGSKWEALVEVGKNDIFVKMSRNGDILPGQRGVDLGHTIHGRPTRAKLEEALRWADAAADLVGHWGDDWTQWQQTVIINPGKRKMARRKNVGYMNKTQFEAYFRKEYMPNVRDMEKMWGRQDPSFRSQTWSEAIDHAEKAGMIDPTKSYGWSQPAWLKGVKNPKKRTRKANPKTKADKDLAAKIGNLKLGRGIKGEIVSADVVESIPYGYGPSPGSKRLLVKVKIPRNDWGDEGNWNLIRSAIDMEVMDLTGNALYFVAHDGDVMHFDVVVPEKLLSNPGHKRKTTRRKTVARGKVKPSLSKTMAKRKAKMQKNPSAAEHEKTGMDALKKSESYFDRYKEHERLNDLLDCYKFLIIAHEELKYSGKKEPRIQARDGLKDVRREILRVMK